MKYFFVIIFLAAAAFGLLLYIQKPKEIKKIQVDPPSLTANILYYGDGCPHCANVEEFLKTKKMPAVFNLVKKEVYNNAINANELIEAAKICNTSGRSIPFLFTQGVCYLGDKDIINFFNKLPE